MSDLEHNIAVLLQDAVPEPPRQITLSDLTSRPRPGRRSTVLVALAAAAAVAVIAISVVAFRPTHHDGSAPPLAPTTSTDPTAANNKAAAQAEAGRLVSMATLPPGAVREAVQPVGLSGPTIGPTISTQVIDRVRYYRIAQSLPRVRAWFQAHPQHGFTLGGRTGSSGAAARTSYGARYDPTSPHWSWGTPSLAISLRSEGPTATAIRVDGIAQWINPTPVRDTSRGRAIRVTITGGCPPTDRGWSDVSNPDAPDLDHQLLPAEVPTAALMCTYNGMHGKAFLLAGSRQLNAAQASAAAAWTRALPLGSQGDTLQNCPNDDSSASIVVFSYAGRADVDIWKTTSGCSFTDNGHIVSGDF